MNRGLFPSVNVTIVAQSYENRENYQNLWKSKKIVFDPKKYCLWIIYLLYSPGLRKNHVVSIDFPNLLSAFSCNRKHQESD